jgi:hypothetical protein
MEEIKVAYRLMGKNRHCFRRRRNYYKRPFFFNAPPPASQSHPYFDL